MCKYIPGYILSREFPVLYDNAELKFQVKLFHDILYFGSILVQSCYQKTYSWVYLLFLLTIRCSKILQKKDIKFSIWMSFSKKKRKKWIENKTEIFVISIKILFQYVFKLRETPTPGLLNFTVVFSVALFLHFRILLSYSAGKRFRNSHKKDLKLIMF